MINFIMKTKIVRLIIFIVMILALSNVFSGLIDLFVQGIGKGYTYETFDGKYKFTYVPSKGGKFERIKIRFKRLQKNEPQYEDTELYRTFEREPCYFWNWYSYMFSEKYDFKYRELSKGSIHYKGLGKQ